MSAESNPFGRRAVAFLIGAGIILALAVMLLSGFGNEIDRATESGGPPADNRTATGFYALRELIAKTGPAKPPLADKNDDFLEPGLLILTPTVTNRPEDILKIVEAREAKSRDYAYDAETNTVNIAAPNDEAETPRLTREDDPRTATLPTLIILPKWATQPMPLQKDRVKRVGFAQSGRLAALIPWIKVYLDPFVSGRPGTVRGSGLLPFIIPDYPHGLIGKDLIPLISAGNLVILGRIKGHDVYVLADPDLLNNYAMRDRRNARAALTLLAALSPEAPLEVTFDTSLHYSPGDRNLFKLMFEPPFLSVTLILMIAAALAGIATANRFGPPRRERRAIAFGRAALIDNVAGLTRLAGRSAEGGARYAQATRDWLARRLRLPRTLTGAALDAHLDKLAGEDRPTIEQLSEQLETARGEAELVRAARQLHDWRKDLTP